MITSCQIAYFRQTIGVTLVQTKVENEKDLLNLIKKTLTGLALKNLVFQVEFTDPGTLVVKPMRFRIIHNPYRKMMFTQSTRHFTDQKILTIHSGVSKKLIGRIVEQFDMKFFKFKNYMCSDDVSRNAFDLFNSITIITEFKDIDSFVI